MQQKKGISHSLRNRMRLFTMYLQSMTPQTGAGPYHRQPGGVERKAT